MAEPGAAAVCAVASALENDLPLLARNIHDAQGNETRFLVLARAPLFEPRADDVTSLVFTVADTAGSLQAALGVFSRHGVNLHKIQSVPDESKPWSISFWLDIGLPAQSERLRNALAELAGACTSLRVLGSYPRLGA